MKGILAALLAVICLVGVADARALYTIAPDPIGGGGCGGYHPVQPPMQPAKAILPQGPPQATVHGFVWGLYFNPISKRLAYLPGFEPGGKFAKTVWG